MIRLADRTSRIASSPTIRVTAAVDRLRREGVAVVDLGAGEPDFATPLAIGAAAHDAIDRDFTKYTPVGGTAELKRAIAARYRLDYGVEYAESEVIACAGGKQALFNTAMALFGPGDEVITHAPYWPSLVEQVKLAGATPVIVRTSAEDGFAIRPEPILAAVTPRTRGILINSPCNPTGALVSEADLDAIAQEAARRNLFVVLDLCYEKLIYDQIPHNLPAVLNRRCRDLGVVCGSASKAYAMTGWRCGWALASAAVIAAAHALQSHATSNVSSITQKAAVAALTGSQEPVAAMLAQYRERRDRFHQWLTAEPLLRCHVPAGAFYLFVDVGDVLSIDGLRTSADFADALLAESQVAVTPGEAFDAPGFIRLSYATAMETLEEGSRRLIAFVGRHAPSARGDEVKQNLAVMSKTVAVIGASSDRRKFGNRAVRAFQQNGYTVVPINPHERQVEGLRAYASVLDVPGSIDMATFYVPPEIGEQVIEDVARKGIPEVWLNPGAESDALVDRARALAIKPIVACSIVAIGENPHTL